MKKAWRKPVCLSSAPAPWSQAAAVVSWDQTDHKQGPCQVLDYWIWSFTSIYNVKKEKTKKKKKKKPIVMIF